MAIIPSVVGDNQYDSCGDAFDKSALYEGEDFTVLIYLLMIRMLKKKN